MKTEGHVQQWAYAITPKLLLAVLVVFAMVSTWTPLVSPEVYSRWLEQFQLIWVFPLLTLVCSGMVYRTMKRQDEGLAFVMSLGIFLFTYLGLIASKWPVIVPPNYTIWDASSAPESQLFLLIGFLCVIPIVLAYTAWS